MKRLKFTFTIILFSPLFLIGQTNSEIEKVPDFMLFSNLSIVKKDTLERICFCFDKLDKQIKNDNFNNNENIKYCKVFEKKYNRNNRSYWIYELFVKKDTAFKIIEEYSKIDSTNNWLMKKYKNNVIISENKIKITDSIIQTSKSYKGSRITENSIPIIRQYLKTEIVN